MRITTLQQHKSGLANMLKNQEALNKTQNQVASGRRVLTPADDPVAATKILQLEQDLAQRGQFESNMTSAQNRLNLEESTLSSVTDYYARLKELTVQAGGGTNTRSDRQAIAAEVEQIQSALVDLFNTRDPNGEYVFAGFKGSEPPFQQQPNGRYEYQGDEGQRFLAIGTATNVATGDSGKELFIDVEAAKNSFTTAVNPQNRGSTAINAGFVVDEQAYGDFYPDDVIITFNPEAAIDPAEPNFTVRRASDNRVIDGMSNQPYVEGQKLVVAGVEITLSGVPEPGDQVMTRSSPKQSITDTLYRLTDGLNNLQDNTTDSATLKTLLEDSLTNLDYALASVSRVQSKIGARLNVVDNTRSLSADIKLVNQEVLSNLKDVDMAEAISRLSLQTTLLEAAQQSYTTISRLSLFNKM
jgi:flagellar hook-associated protein 3 FlgL